jgi:hypothetical protein
MYLCQNHPPAHKQTHHDDCYDDTFQHLPLHFIPFRSEEITVCHFYEF